MKVDVLLIGQGLAGTVLSHALQEQGYTVAVVDHPQQSVSSRVAAGLYNPVTGRQMVKTWWADKLFPLIPAVYGTLERLTGKKFMHEQPIYRPFFSIAEQNDWFGRWSDPAYAPYIQQVVDTPLLEPWVRNPYGGLLLQQTGWIDIPVLLDSWREYLQEKHLFLQEVFDEDQLQLHAEGVRYKHLEADRVVYCTGTAQLKSRYWQWLPLRPVKGDVLLLKTDATLPLIPNRGVFMVPTGDQLFRAGSTYNHHDLSLEPSEKGRLEIEEKLHELVNMQWEVLDHQVGIRPATKDRRPVLGPHPEHQNMFVFNGLGTKGVSLAPYCAKILAEHLKMDAELPTEICIKRFYSLY